MSNREFHMDISKIPALIPTIYGRVGDYSALSVDIFITKDNIPFNLVGWKVAFEGLSPGGVNKIHDEKNIKIMDGGRGYINYTFPKEIFENPGSFKKAYFSFKKDKLHESTSKFNIKIVNAIKQ